MWLSKVYVADYKVFLVNLQSQVKNTIREQLQNITPASPWMGSNRNPAISAPFSGRHKITIISPQSRL